MADESLMAAWRVAEAASGGPETSEPAATEPAETQEPAATTASTPEPKTEPAKSDQAASVAETGDSAELKQLKELATKLNMKLEDGRVTVAERVALREEKREAKARIAKLETELLGRVAEKEKGLDPFIAAKKAWEAKDIDGFAKALGHDSWAALNGEMLNHFADPNYKLIQELRRKDAEREEALAKEREQLKQTEQNRARMEAQAAYKKTLAQELAGSPDPLCKALADDPMFQDVIYRIQQSRFDQESGSTVTPEEALEIAQNGKTFRSEMLALYKRLHAAFGGQTAAAPPAKTGKTGKTSQREAERPHVVKNAGSGFMDPSEREYWAQQLKASQE